MGGKLQEFSWTHPAEKTKSKEWIFQILYAFNLGILFMDIFLEGPIWISYENCSSFSLDFSIWVMFYGYQSTESTLSDILN